jgi:large subunit ribosomal protein L21
MQKNAANHKAKMLLFNQKNKLRIFDLKLPFKYTYSFRLSDKFSADETGANKMSYAIIRTGGKQFSVEAGQTLRVPSIEKNEGDKVEIETLLVGNGDSISLAAATVGATIISHGRGDKIIVFKKKRRKQYKRRQGHRQGYTEITIDKI